MEQAMQIALGREILSAMQARRTAMAESIYENPVSDYISPEQAALERQRLFHGHPLVMALSGELPGPGDFITNDWSGKPILLVRGDDGKVDGSEHGIDCGGGTCPGCPNGTPCNQGNDCATGTCIAGTCVDCGGANQPCCPGGACDAMPDTCAEITTLLPFT